MFSESDLLIRVNETTEYSITVEPRKRAAVVSSLHLKSFLVLGQIMESICGMFSFSGRLAATVNVYGKEHVAVLEAKGPKAHQSGSGTCS